MSYIKPNTHLIMIDGVDGGGKKTLIENLKEYFEGDQLQVRVIAAPHYETLSGHNIRQFLTEGYGNWTSPIPAALLYSVDRNLYFRDHFEEIFYSGNYDVIILDRSWMANLIFFTALVSQDDDSTASINERYPIYINNAAGSYTEMLTLAEMHNILIKTTPKYDFGEFSVCFGHKEPLHPAYFGMDIGQLIQTYYYQRAYKVRHMMNLLYESEVAIWRIPTEEAVLMDNDDMIKRSSAPCFLESKNLTVDSIMLTPNLDWSIIMKLNGRLNARQDEEKGEVDRNEKSLQLQMAVAENIKWIHKNLNFLLSFEAHSPQIPNGFHTDGMIQLLNRQYIPDLFYSKAPYGMRRAFSYSWVAINDPTTDELFTREEMLKRVLSAIHFQ